METDITITVATKAHLIYVDSICRTIAESAQARGTGIAGRSAAYLRQKMLDGKAIIATLKNGQWAGFAYLDVWDNGQFVSHSGLIVAPDFRRHGIAQQIKRALFSLSRCLFPKAKLFSITTGQAVMNLNSQLGFRPVAFSELPQDDRFWNQCSSCKNCDILARTGRKYCLCTGMLYEPLPSEKAG
ncbi:GNAT family N-acetyltransferase [Spirosoma endbachense]|uniref:GNAT family N-acetyltransferase n=1 Tax=Spirosoma endbachense TaxID=2666025 RepID=A0A6P1VZ78_9BACT|nr:GNAT family N-acetyltransferase [Spirosoma endbachense]QHV97080.1 GNAT family N-acetyltransferase [Spirosoma endbachense]